MAALTVPLTWPPAPTSAPRWHHHLAYVIADIHDRIGRAHHHLTILRANTASPTGPDLAERLHHIDQAAVDPHDPLYLHQLLTGHGLDDVAAHLDCARAHQRPALTMLRRLTERARRGQIDPDRLAIDLERIAAQLTAAGLALVDADRALLTAIHPLPTQGGDRYSQ
jgi:hypothetical protein